jgi:hypothetical protein
MGPMGVMGLMLIAGGIGAVRRRNRQLGFSGFSIAFEFLKEGNWLWLCAQGERERLEALLYSYVSLSRRDMRQ